MKEKIPIFAPVNPRENGLMKKAHFSLYSAIGKLGHFTKMMQELVKMNASLEYCISTMLQVE